jgi:hypothetical protein
MWISSAYLDGLPFRFRTPPPGVRSDSLVLPAADLREVRAVCWAPAPDGPKSRTAVIAMHPRVDFTHHYLFPALLAAGHTCLGALSRNLGDDTDTIHEDLCLDVAACVKHLRGAGFERVMLLGNSGGGSLMGLYQSQAELPADQRLERTPGGRRTVLRQAPLPPGDGLLLVAAHRGQGHVLLRSIDPSVTDEADPLSVDPALDPYDPANGFRPPPEWSRYDPAFVARYREAQRARVARIDATARRALDERRAAKGTRAAHLARILVVYRTSATLECVDASLDPSDRAYGTLLSADPPAQNLERLGYARVVTPEAWLSTWSGLSSRADLGVTLRGVRVPVGVVHAGGDREVFPNGDQAPIVDALVAEDRTVAQIAGAGHYFEPAGSAARGEVERFVVDWVTARSA